jgi:hypothetical protein
VRRFSRPVKLESVLIYDDNRADGAGSVADLVAG